MKTTVKLMFASLILVVASGCATNRGVIDIPDGISINPAEGQAIKFVRVSDTREFQLKPPQANIPSLKNGEIDIPGITERAIARKRNSYGKALGDILLPEGKTIMGVVENRLSEGFRENGYRVIVNGEDGYDTATPIEVDIEKFWGWFSPGFWSVGINFETSILVTAPVNGFSEGVQFDSEVQKRFQTASGGNWKTVIDLSLGELNKDIEAKIQKIQEANTSGQESQGDL